MVSEFEEEMAPTTQFCPECGTEEYGYFCRNCGTLLRGQARVLCPRCHGVVPEGEYCNRCGQNLGAIALNLQQLALAGDDFWVTAAVAAPATQEPDAGLFAPDESLDLEDGELPDWLQELPAKEAPVEVKERIHPALQPMERPPQAGQQSSFLSIALVLMGLLLLGLIALLIFLVIQGG